LIDCLFIPTYKSDTTISTSFCRRFLIFIFIKMKLILSMNSRSVGFIPMLALVFTLLSSQVGTAVAQQVKEGDCAEDPSQVGCNNRTMTQGRQLLTGNEAGIGTGMTMLTEFLESTPGLFPADSLESTSGLFPAVTVTPFPELRQPDLPFQPSTPNVAMPTEDICEECDYENSSIDIAELKSTMAAALDELDIEFERSATNMPCDDTEGSECRFIKQSRLTSLERFRDVRAVSYAEFDKAACLQASMVNAEMRTTPTCPIKGQGPERRERPSSTVADGIETVRREGKFEFLISYASQKRQN
jgi:hypothetical protein